MALLSRDAALATARSRGSAIAQLVLAVLLLAQHCAAEASAGSFAQHGGSGASVDATSSLVALAEHQRRPGVASVQKVIELLEDISAKAKQDSKDEEVLVAKFETWCEQEGARLVAEIAKNSESIELLKAESSKLASDSSALGEAIAKLQDTVAGAEADKAKAKSQREKDHAAFLQEQQDYTESVDAIERALAALQKEDYDRGAHMALLQLTTAGKGRLPSKLKSVASAFVDILKSTNGTGLSYEAPRANAYEFQSGGVVELLKKLLDEFRGTLGDCQKQEMNSKHASSTVVQDLEDLMSTSNTEIAEKSQEKARKDTTNDQVKKQLAATIDEKAANEKTLSDTKTECNEKRLSIEEKQRLRAEEIEAIAKAIGILSSEDVLGNAHKYLSLASVAQAGQATALLQGASVRPVRIHELRKLRDFISAESRRIRSRGLGLLAEKLAADPFADVKKLVREMIDRLSAEANEDATNEGFCDKEVGMSKVTRTKLSEQIDALTAGIKDGQSQVISLTQDIAGLNADIAAIDVTVENKTAVRKSEREEYEVTMEDVSAAKKAVDAATAILKEFYSKAATATALLQAPPPERQWRLMGGAKMGTDQWKELANPGFAAEDSGHEAGMQTFGEVYSGRQAEAQNGVLGLLEVIKADFLRLEAETTAQEAASQTAHEKFMADSKSERAVKTRKAKMNAADKVKIEAQVESDTADLKSTDEQLVAKESYYQHLVRGGGPCANHGTAYGVTFEDRMKAREAEIASLKEALQLLRGEHTEPVL